jgi:hypothetical protein
MTTIRRIVAGALLAVAVAVGIACAVGYATTVAYVLALALATVSLAVSPGSDEEEM